MTPHNEKIQFRLLKMPCCGQQLCWVNPRLPNHCPECGSIVYLALKGRPELTLVSDGEAWLRFRMDSPAEIEAAKNQTIKIELTCTCGAENRPGPHDAHCPMNIHSIWRADG